MVKFPAKEQEYRSQSILSHGVNANLCPCWIWTICVRRDQEQADGGNKVVVHNQELSARADGQKWPGTDHCL